MKNTIITLLIIGSFCSCNFIAGSKADNTDSTQMASVDSLQGYAPVRDASITAANAYSDLFLDSAVLENFICQQKIDGSAAQNLRNFYKVRNYQYAWLASDGFTEQGRGFWNLYHQKGDDDKTDNLFKEQVDSLFEKDSVQITTTDSTYRNTELKLSQEYVQYAQSKGQINNMLFAIPRKKMEVMQWADSILHKQRDTAQYSNNKMYAALRGQLNNYYGIAQNGGWQTINWPGSKGNPAAISALKKRLQLTHDWNSADTSSSFTDSLKTAIKSVQQQYGLHPTGMVNDSLISALNVPVQKRIEQIIINLNRAQWMTGTITDSNSIQVNIPSQMLYVYSDTGKVLEMPVVIGKEGTSTLMFNGNINEVVFSPEWNIPQSIVQKEIMPKVKQDPHYLKKHHMEIVGNQKDSLPQLKELPNPRNPLGKVKFLFPNNYEIFLHDTPDKTAFKKKDRTISHGCIRVAQPEALAAYLLKDQSDWNDQKIKQAMNKGEQQKVEVKKQTPVTISYFTAWVDKNGKMNFRDDVYKLDDRTGQKMFSPHA